MGDLDLSDLAGVEDFESLSADDTAGLVERLVVGVVEDDNSDNGGGIAAPDTRKTNECVRKYNIEQEPEFRTAKQS